MPSNKTTRPEVFERDIDALIERRIKSDAEFAQALFYRLTSQCNLSISCDGYGVDRQVPHVGATGTIDLLVRAFSQRSGEIGCILLENKLDSSFTPTQPERYAASAAAMSRSGRPAISAICAPKDYLQKSKYLDCFQSQVSYEEFATWVDGDDRDLVKSAILRFLMPYEPDPDPNVRDFHEGYVNLIQQIAPEIIVKPNPNVTGERPEASRTIYFVTKKTLPRWNFLPTLRFSHQCWDSSAQSPSVKIMFDGWAKHETLLRKHSSALGNTHFYLRKAGRSLGLVRDTPRMDNKIPVGQQLNAVTSGIRAAAALRAWMYANETTLREWVAAIANDEA
jgi:hypothetical protein